MNLEKYYKQSKKLTGMDSTKSNDVTSFFFYMWNAWCKEECQKVFSVSGNWMHFWNKWCGICEAHSVYGAAERFYAELSNDNRDLLVKRATDLYVNDCRIKENFV